MTGKKLSNIIKKMISDKCTKNIKRIEGESEKSKIKGV